MASPFVGRAEELQQLVAAATTAPAVALLEGEAGIGKTRLVAEMASRAEPAGRRIAIGRCGAIREPFPLGPLVEVVRNLGDTLVPADLSPVAGALRPLVPELAGLLPPLPAPLDDRVGDRHRVFRGLLEVLKAAGSMTVVLEDLHWADEHTVDFLRYTLGDPPPTLSWVLTFRGEDVAADVRALATRLPATVRRTHVVLSPLGAEQTGALAAAVARVDRLPDRFTSYLCERTGGLPFAIEQVMELLRERGVTPRPDAAWLWAGADALTVPAGIRDHVVERLDRLPLAAQSLLEVLAVLQSPATEQRLARVSGLPASEVAAGLSAAIRSGLLTEESDQVRFRHVLAAQSVYETIVGPRRRDLHGRAADTLRAEGDHLLGQVAHHLRRAGRLDEWAPVAERAADQATALGHDDEAVRLLVDVLRQVRLPAEAAGRIAVKLGELAYHLLRAIDVTDLLARVLELDLPVTVRGEVQLWLGALVDRTDLGARRSRPLFREAVANLTHDPALRGWAMVALEMRTPPDTGFAWRSARLHEVLEFIPSIGDADAETFLLGRAALVLTLLGDPSWPDVAARIEERTRGKPRRFRQVGAYENLATALTFIGHHRPARRFVSVASEGAVGCENDQLQALCQSNAALLDYCSGRWGGLAETAAELIEQLTEYPRPRSRVELVAGNLALARGDLEEAAGLLESVMARFEGEDGSDALPMAVGSIVRLHVSQGDLAAGLEIVERYLDKHVTHITWPATCRALPWLVHALTAAGRGADAEDLVSLCEDELQGRDAPLASAALHHSRGFIAMAGGDTVTADRHFSTAAKHYAVTAAPYEAALAHEEAATARAGGVGMDRIAAPLAAALATYSELGADRDLARAAQTARRHGVRTPSRYRNGRRGYGGGLSPREREVAELAATGTTNKEIAAVLFVSVETVKKHLTAAMRKLGVSSRTALAHQFRHAGEADGRTSLSG